MMTSPPRPPSPPEGPPRGTNFSRRKAIHPLPPSPAFTRILASSINIRSFQFNERDTLDSLTRRQAMDWPRRSASSRGNVRLPQLQKIAWLALLLAPAMGICAGQSDTGGSVAGRVVDEAGKGVSAALVRMENATTGERSDSICDLRGNFRFAEVTPGGYTLRVHAQGLSDWEADNLEIGLGTAARLNARLAPSWIHRTILVDAGLASAGSSQASAGESEDSGTAMQDLPNNGQHWSNLAGLPGGSTSGEDGALSFR